ncbi:MAG: chemotaxis-specific protein-glutamate methyltransferase CheB [Helicobacteraceae bacterium]|nr:chemotaxis-specific protein-glutamate methyltransferase CheB [Helicobacteraceae bacterium]
MIKVFIIDDSITVRAGFKNLLKDIVDIEVLGEANNPIDALEIFQTTGFPDLFLLDIEMPKMDGLTFLRKINEQRPTPVIICSTLVEEGSEALLDALHLGATFIIEKPRTKLSSFFKEYKDELIENIRVAANTKVKYNSNFIESKKVKKISTSLQTKSENVIAIGSSTGGVQVLEEIVTNLKESHQGVVVVQHMPKGFTASFAKRLNDIAPYSTVYEAKDGDIINNSSIYIAPGDNHMEIQATPEGYKIVISYSEKINSHRPSVNTLFKSVAIEAKNNALGFILTGMGNDGADGLKKMLNAGASTYAQNEKSSTVYGMPKVAQEIGATKEMLSIFNIIKLINEY